MTKWDYFWVIIEQHCSSDLPLRMCAHAITRELGWMGVSEVVALRGKTHALFFLLERSSWCVFFSPLTSTFSSYFRPLTIGFKASGCYRASNGIISACPWLPYASKCKMWFTSTRVSALSHFCRFSSFHLRPRWTQIKVKWAVDFAKDKVCEKIL